MYIFMIINDIASLLPYIASSFCDFIRKRSIPSPSWELLKNFRPEKQRSLSTHLPPSPPIRQN
jgi:hypothetical protein